MKINLPDGTFTTIPDGIDPALVIIGPVGGHATINGTVRGDTIIGLGSYNTINGLGGNDTIIAIGGGYQTVNIGMPGDRVIGNTDTVTLAGASDSVTGGDANIMLSGNVSAGTFIAGNGNDNFNLAGAGNFVSVGTGRNAITATGGGATINFGYNAGGHPISGALSDSITLSGLGNTVNESYNIGVTQNAIITGGAGNGNFSFGVSDVTLTTSGFHNSFDLYGGDDTITAGSGYDSVTFDAPGSSSAIELNLLLAGQHNDVEGRGDATIIGGGGESTYKLGPTVLSGGAMNGDGGAYTVMTGGLHNTIALSNSAASTIDAGSGDDTATINYSTVGVTLNGSGDMLFIDSEAPSVAILDNTVTVQGSYTGLQASFGSQHGVNYGDTVNFTTFGGSDVLHIVGGGGFTTTAQVVAALKSDGAGGFNLALSEGAIHFGAGSVLSVSNFALQ